MKLRRRFGWTFSTQYNTDTESSIELNYHNAEEGPSRTEPTESSEERQQAEALLEDLETDIDSELATSFLWDSRNLLKKNPFKISTFPPITSIITMAQPQQQTNVANGHTKELSLNRPTPFTGNRQKVNTFLQECNLYLLVNRAIYNTDKAKIIFILSYMTNKEVL